MERFLGVVGDPGHRPGPLYAIVSSEHLDRPPGVVTVGGVADLSQRRARAGVHAGGQAAQHVGELVKP
jgi:hypothetical protein